MQIRYEIAQNSLDKKVVPMLKLALCDDDGEQLAATTALLRQYAAERPELAVKLSFFSSSPSL